jgi:hypothetical protein
MTGQAGEASGNVVVKYPAVNVVHWATGPVNACAEHTEKLLGLARFMGLHVGVTPCTDGAECSNCINEAKAGKR